MSVVGCTIGTVSGGFCVVFCAGNAAVCVRSLTMVPSWACVSLWVVSIVSRRACTSAVVLVSNLVTLVCTSCTCSSCSLLFCRMLCCACCNSSILFCCVVVIVLSSSIRSLSWSICSSADEVVAEVKTDLVSSKVLISGPALVCAIFGGFVQAFGLGAGVGAVYPSFCIVQALMRVVEMNSSGFFLR